MEEKKKDIPNFGCIDFLSGQRPEGLPKARVIKTGKTHHTENNAPIEVKNPYEAVFVGLRLENPSTGESTIVDAKIDAGATVTLVPMSMVSDLALEVIGEADFAAANGGVIHTYIA